MRFVLFLIVLLLLTACAPQPDTFTVDYYATRSSSEAEQVLDITYTVENGTITSCDGSYTVSNARGEFWEVCDVEKLLAGGYDVPLEVVMSAEKRQGESMTGPNYYRWTIR